MKVSSSFCLALSVQRYTIPGGNSPEGHLGEGGYLASVVPLGGQLMPKNEGVRNALQDDVTHAQ